MPVHCYVSLAGRASSLTLACEPALHMRPAVSASPRPLAGTIPTCLCWVSRGHCGPQVHPDGLGLSSSSTPPGDPRMPPCSRNGALLWPPTSAAVPVGPSDLTATRSQRHGDTELFWSTKGPGSQGTEATLLSEGPVSGAPLVLC